MPTAKRHDKANNRLPWLLATIIGLAGAVFLRIVTIEVWYGDAYREMASRPIERVVPLAAARGRILAKDGRVLACDREVAALAVHYRYLQQPPNRAWLHRLARGRLPRKQRRQTDLVEAECRRIVEEQAELHQRLAELCGLDSAALRSQLARIQERIERIASSVRARREERPVEASTSDHASGWRKLLVWLEQASSAPLSSENLTVAEEYEYHPVYVGLALEAVAEIEGHPDRYPGVRIVTWRQRVYPQGTLAAHAIGYVPDAPAELLGAQLREKGTKGPTGQQGVERYYDALLRGSLGQVREATDRSGRLVWRRLEREPTPGGDLTLSIDPALQGTAEQLLDHALERRLARAGAEPRGGGAVVIMDIQTGELLCSAAAPRFAPETMARGNPAEVERLLTAESTPLFDRACRMALPPGSAFKPLTAIALVEDGIVDPARSFYCQGYLHTPERQRCQIFRQSQTGHGPLTLAEALARSCNVYFFHYAQQTVAERLLDWAEQFGFGAPTGIDLPDEAAGSIVKPEMPTTADVLALAIGQGTLTATPLQMARLMAAIGSGGRLIRPRVVSRNGSPDFTTLSMSDQALAAVRRGLELVVADSQGTANATVRLDSVPIAGKTGTAETAAGQDHAWFAGYVPANDPKLALAIVMEYGGSGGESAGPVARRLVEKMESLGYFGRRKLVQRADAARNE